MNSFLYLGDALTCRASALHWHFKSNHRFDEMLAPSVENNPLDYFQHSPLAERPTDKSELPTKLAIRFMV
jgi:hypothetical protein